MPSILLNLRNGSHYPAQGLTIVQSMFNVSLPLIDTPKFLNNTAQFAKDHPEEVKVAVFGILAVVAVIASCFVLPLLGSVFTAIVAGLAAVVKAVIMSVIFVLKTILQPFIWVAAGVLNVVGFTARGIAAGSIAASTQSVVYGAFTTGLFSVLQSLGVIIGRLAGAVVAVVV